jgi:hypothetical protein
MRLPPQLRVAIGPSRIARVFVIVVALGTAVVTAQLPLPSLLIVGAETTLLLWAAVRWRSFSPRRGRSSIVEVALTADRLIVVRNATGALRAGFVREASYVSPSLTAIVWKPDGDWRSRVVLLLPDMTHPEDFRRLRVLLRYGRREAEAGAPASQA